MNAPNVIQADLRLSLSLSGQTMFGANLFEGGDHSDQHGLGPRTWLVLPQAFQDLSETAEARFQVLDDLFSEFVRLGQVVQIG